MSPSDYRGACVKAENHNRQITSNDLKEYLTVRHMDGSCFIISSGLLVFYKKRYLIAYGEHQQPTVFFLEDITFAGYGIGMEAIRNLVTEGWYVYMGWHRNDLEKTKVKVGVLQKLGNLPIDFEYLERFSTESEAKEHLKQIRKFNRSKKKACMEDFMRTTPRG